jgi:hypothetical protein
LLFFCFLFFLKVWSGRTKPAGPQTKVPWLLTHIFSSPVNFLVFVFRFERTELLCMDQNLEFDDDVLKIETPM